MQHFKKRYATARSNRPFAVATTRKTHARALPTRARKLARARSAQPCDLRAAATVNGRFDHNVVERFENTA
eukprot:2174470-Lingulodinium_polyedra.AAC.1